MRRLLLTTTALFLALPASAHGQHWTRTVETTVNIRAGPGTEHGVVDQAEAGERVYVSRDKRQGWHPVFPTRSSTDTTGWIKGTLLVAPGRSSTPVANASQESGGESGGISTGWWIFLFVLYFLPALRATIRGHHNASAIGLLNFFFGWTILGWLGALIWAETAVDESKK